MGESAGDGAAVLLGACERVAEGAVEDARRLLREEYPFAAPQRAGRRYTTLDAVRVFSRDGFIDRYGGERLVFPGVLRLLSHLMPEEFPWHSHGKMELCHIAHWTLGPSLDHLVPLARGGADAEANWVTTSVLRNMSKGQATLEELGWTLHPPGRLGDWDGLAGWFLAYTERRPEFLHELRPLRDWKRALRTVLAERGTTS